MRFRRRIAVTATTATTATTTTKTTINRVVPEKGPVPLPEELVPLKVMAWVTAAPFTVTLPEDGEAV